MKTLKVAVQGCCHGELDIIYSNLANKRVDLLIITGDFQALRNLTDLNTISVPAKYKQLGQFHNYYSLKKKASIPTIFVGGNHECSSYLKELKYGGWVAPNIYFLGEYGCIWYKGLRISGISGIYNEQSFIHNHNALEDPKLPYTPVTLRSVYHMTTKNFVKLLLTHCDMPLDIVVSHDWPQYIYHYGDLQGLLKRKPFFKQDVESGRLGNPLLRHALNELTPRYWFSSHLHVKFEAKVDHIADKAPITDEIDIDMDDMDDEKDKNTQSKSSQDSTQFLALDKCGRSRSHLEIKDIVVDSNHISFKNNSFYYDTRAVCINRVVESYVNSPEWLELSPKSLISTIPTSLISILDQKVKSEMDSINRDPDHLKIPENFEIIAPAGTVKPPLQYWPNNQTLEYCQKFNIINK